MAITDKFFFSILAVVALACGVWQYRNVEFPLRGHGVGRLAVVGLAVQSFEPGQFDVRKQSLRDERVSIRHISIHRVAILERF